ncbi:MAG: VOC family protein [Treponema sp.]|jgi:PhnB protein|nr:VOC family protein [Treponema sp.]
MVAPFLNFYGCCGEAIELYEKVFTVKNKQVQLFGDIPGIPENMKSWILHAEMEMEGQTFWLGDCFSPEQCAGGLMITLAVTFPTVEKVTEVFNKLLEGGSVLIELSPKPYSPMHGCVKDKFGVGWQITAR